MNIINIILKSFVGSIHYEKSTDISDTILLSGCARGGTTWVSNIINHDNSYRYIFEPFNPKYVKQFKDFKYRQYIRCDQIDQRLYDATKKILQGQVRNFWIDPDFSEIDDKLIINRFRLFCLFKFDIFIV